MLSMVDSDEIPLPVSILSLGNIMYGDIKPITKLISYVNYNAVICIPDFLLSLILPVLSLSIGYFIRKNPRKIPRINLYKLIQQAKNLP